MKNAKSFWDGKNVLVTGGAGFIGSHVVEELLRRAPRARVTVCDDLSRGKRDNLKAVAKDIRWLKADLRSMRSCLKACRGQDAVLHLAARVAGVGYNSAHHATMFRHNAMISGNLLEAARLSEARRVLLTSSACVYAAGAPVPTPETAGFEGRPEATNEGYGWAKRMAEFLGRSYAKEFGLEVAIVRPYNNYGPRDHYDGKDNHVIAALMNRVGRGNDPVVVWGDGSPTRDFLYVEDTARGMLDAAEKYACGDPLNLGAEEEISIADLARLILKVSGSPARLHFDRSKPSGQPRRGCDVRKAREKIGFRAQVGLEDGLRRAWNWYRRHVK